MMFVCTLRGVWVFFFGHYNGHDHGVGRFLGSCQRVIMGFSKQLPCGNLYHCRTFHFSVFIATTVLGLPWHLGVDVADS